MRLGHKRKSEYSLHEVLVETEVPPFSFLYEWNDRRQRLEAPPKGYAALSRQTLIFSLLEINKDHADLLQPLITTLESDWRERKQSPGSREYDFWHRYLVDRHGLKRPSYLWRLDMRRPLTAKIAFGQKTQALLSCDCRVDSKTRFFNELHASFFQRDAGLFREHISFLFFPQFPSSARLLQAQLPDGYTVKKYAVPGKKEFSVKKGDHEHVFSYYGQLPSNMFAQRRPQKEHVDELNGKKTGDSDKDTESIAVFVCRTRQRIDKNGPGPRNKKKADNGRNVSFFGLPQAV